MVKCQNDMERDRRQIGFINNIVDKMGPQLRTAAIERLVSNPEIIYPLSFDQEYQSAIRNGYFPIVISSHQAHIDGVNISLLTKGLTRKANEILPDEQKTKGFLLPLATSLATGDQDPRLKTLYDDTKPVLNANNLYPVNLTRPKDIRRYGLSSNRDEFEMNMLIKIDQGYNGIVIFPEGSVQAGRRKENGQINGMQPFKEGSIRNVVSIAKQRNEDILFIPVGISGGPAIFDQDNNKPTSKAFISMLPFASNGIRINVGTPIKSDTQDLNDLININNSETNKKLNDFFAFKVAALLPPQEQGVYAK